MKNIITIFILSLMAVGCKKSTSMQHNIQALSDRQPAVSLQDAPKDAFLVGNIEELLPVVFKVTVPSIKVMVKVSENESWSVLEASQKPPAATYIYDIFAHQVRFQNCEAGWGYALIEVKQ